MVPDCCFKDCKKEATWEASSVFTGLTTYACDEHLGKVLDEEEHTVYPIPS